MVSSLRVRLRALVELHYEARPTVDYRNDDAKFEVIWRVHSNAFIPKSLKKIQRYRSGGLQKT